MSDATPATIPCPACGKSARGRYCSHCGAQLEPAACAQCDALLLPGDKYCFECGAKVVPNSVATDSVVEKSVVQKSVAKKPVVDVEEDEEEESTVVAPAGAGSASKLPWIVVGGAVAAVIALAAWNSMKDDQFSGQATQAAQAVGLDPSQMGGAAGAPAGDPLAMDPLQQADRMYDRVMRLASEGKKDSVQFFAPIAFQIYGALGPLDLDQHYDFGNVAHTAGMDDVARAHADTILAKDPSHLLGLALKFRSSTGAAQKSAAQKLVADEASEMKKTAQKPEYTRHSSDIEMAVAEAKKLLGG